MYTFEKDGKEIEISNETKREDYISWNKYFMNLAIESTKRSKDPRTQVGACIVKDNKILSLGYNGFPSGCNDDEFPWNSEASNILYLKNTFVVHAELNAILSYKGSVEGATMYVTRFPCNECAKAIIQSGIKKIFYKDRKFSEIEEASIMMFNACGVEFEQYCE